MIPLLKSTVKLRKTSHCVIARDTAAPSALTMQLAPLEAAVLALCDGSNDTNEIAVVLPKTLTGTMRNGAESYVKSTLERCKSFICRLEAPVAGNPRYKAADFLYIPQKLTPTGRFTSPVGATLLITYRCNFRCIYCYNNSGPAQREQLSTADWLEAIRQLSAETECQSVFLSGGEPLIHPGFFDILAAGRRAGMLMDFTTNGSLVNNEAVRRLKDLEIGYVRVSLDSPYTDMHHRLTQTSDTFKKVTHSIEAMSTAGIKVGVKGILFDGNCRDAEKLTSFVRNLGATDVMLDAYDCMSSGRGKGKLTLSDENYAAVKAGEGALTYTTRNSQHYRYGEDDISVCAAWTDSLTISPDGTFSFCEALADDAFFTLGKFPEDSIMAAWRSPRIDEILHTDMSQCDKECACCEFFEKCHTGCFKNKAMAGLGHYERDPYCKIS